MGSFLQTCAVSGLPICAGEPVVGFILTQSYAYRDEDNFTGWVGSGALYQTISLPFFGIYDDYGSIELEDTTHADPIFKFLTGRSVTELITAIGEDRDTHTDLDLGSPYGKHPMHLMLVHRGIFDKLAEGGEVRWKQSNLDEQVGLIAPFFKIWQETTEGSRAGSRSNGLGMNWMVMASEARYAWWNRPDKSDEDTECLIASFFSSGESEGIHSRFKYEVKDLLSTNWDKVGLEGHLPLLRAVLQLQFFDIGMRRLRKFWQPQTGLGAQDEADGLHRMVHEWAIAHLDEKRAEQMAYWNEDMEGLDEDGEPIVGFDDEGNPIESIEVD